MGGCQAAQRSPTALTYQPTAPVHGGGCAMSWLVEPLFPAGPVPTTEPPARCWPFHPNLLTPRPQPNRTPYNSISQVKSWFLYKHMSNVSEKLKRNTHSRPFESGAGYVRLHGQIQPQMLGQQSSMLGDKSVSSRGAYPASSVFSQRSSTACTPTHSRGH